VVNHLRSDSKTPAVCSGISGDGRTQLSATAVVTAKWSTAVGFLATQDGWHRHKVDSEASDLTERSQRVLEQERSAKQQWEDGCLAMGLVICTNR